MESSFRWKKILFRALCKITAGQSWCILWAKNAKIVPKYQAPLHVIAYFSSKANINLFKMFMISRIVFFFFRFQQPTVPSCWSKMPHKSDKFFVFALLNSEHCSIRELKKNDAFVNSFIMQMRVVWLRKVSDKPKVKVRTHKSKLKLVHHQSFQAS